MMRPRGWIAFGLGSALLVACGPARAQDSTATAVKDVTGDRPVLEIVFVLDTTGSMAGMIDGAKQKIWGIVNDVLKAKDHPDVRVGLVIYRDRGDQYVTKVFPVTSDLDKIYTTLMDSVAAGGGGDGPEDVRRALAEGVRKAGWAKRSPKVAQILFLVGDAEPHDDYQDEPDTLVSAAEGVKAGLIINAIQCGGAERTRASWQAIARQGEGRYFAIAQDGGVQVVASPMDKKLGELGAKLGGTIYAYGGGAGPEGLMMRAAVTKAQAATEGKVLSAPAPAAADRAVNKILNREAYAHDLLQAIENGSTTLEAVKPDDLPDDLKPLSPEARKKAVDARLAERKAIRAEILELAKQRDAFLAEERRKLAAAPGGLDNAVSGAIREQAAKRGIRW